MPKLPLEVSGMKAPYPFYSSIALSADIQNTKTPEEAFEITQTFQKACALCGFISKSWNEYYKSKNVHQDLDSTPKIYIDIPGYPANTIYLDIWKNYLWINFPSSTKTDRHGHPVDWSFPVTPHALYCVLRLNIKHITGSPTSAYDIKQIRECAPKLHKLADTLLAKDAEEADEADEADESDELRNSEE